MKKNIKKAFTLIEMLIVIIIIGILMAALYPKIMWAQAGARDTARKAWIKQLSTALMQYYNDNSEYPVSSTHCVLALSWVLSTYIQKIPTDPQKNRITYGIKGNANGCKWEFAYTVLKKNGSDKSSYMVITNMEKVWRDMNYVLSWRTAYSSWLDEVDLIENVCDKGVVLSWNSWTGICTSSERQWWIWKHNNADGVYIDFWA